MGHRPGTAWTSLEIEETLREKFPDLDFPYINQEFTRTTDWITVSCQKHGLSKKQPHKLMTAGQGCPACGEESRVKAVKYSTADVLSLFNEVHGDRYDYSKVRVTYAMENVTIVCKEHGAFQQTPQSHYMGKAGCPLCSRVSKPQCQPIPFLEFVRRATEAHKGRYHYSDEGYSGISRAVKVTCMEHGVFIQDGFDHIYGAGCPSCNPGGFNQTKSAFFYLYIILVRGVEHLGFGITSNLTFRDTQHQSAFSSHGISGRMVNSLRFKLGYYALELERHIKKYFDSYSIGVPGFKTETVSFSAYSEVLEYCLKFHECNKSKISV